MSYRIRLARINEHGWNTARSTVPIIGRSIGRGRNATVSLSRVGAAITRARISAAGAGRVSLHHVRSAVADSLLHRAGAGAATTAVNHAASIARSIRSDTMAAVDQRIVRRKLLITQIAPLQPDWRPPLQPWIECEPRADRFPVHLSRSACSSRSGSFESSGLAGPGRRSNGSAEKRKLRTT
jgi:hypothetical protein